MWTHDGECAFEGRCPVPPWLFTDALNGGCDWRNEAATVSCEAGPGSEVERALATSERLTVHDGEDYMRDVPMFLQYEHGRSRFFWTDRCERTLRAVSGRVYEIYIDRKGALITI